MGFEKTHWRKFFCGLFITSFQNSFLFRLNQVGIGKNRQKFQVERTRERMHYYLHANKQITEARSKLNMGLLIKSVFLNYLLFFQTAIFNAN